MRISITEAKARFAEVIRRAESGEEVVLTRYGKAVARIVSAEQAESPSWIGFLKGEIEMPGDFDEQLPDDILGVFEGTVGPS